MSCEDLVASVAGAELLNADVEDVANGFYGAKARRAIGEHDRRAFIHA